MSPLALIVLAGVGTYLLRISAIALSGRLGSPSPGVEQTLRLIAPAVLSASVADRLVLVRGEFTPNWPWWFAAVVTVLVALRWRSAGITMAAGMCSVWIIAVFVD